MAIAHIEHWLKDNARDYQRGCELYDTYGNSSYLKSLFRQGDDEYNRDRLVEELKKIVKNSPHIVPQAPDRSKKSEVKEKPEQPKDTNLSSEDSYVRFSEVRMPKIDTSKLPEDLQKMVIEKGSLYKKCCSLHQQLPYMSKDSERMKAANEILDSFKIIDRIWRELDYFEKYGFRRPSDGRDLAKLSYIQLINRRNTLRTYVSKRKYDADLTLYQQYVNELDSVDRLIKRKEDENE
jgi:hypothetical protein